MKDARHQGHILYESINMKCPQKQIPGGGSGREGLTVQDDEQRSGTDSCDYYLPLNCTLQSGLTVSSVTLCGMNFTTIFKKMFPGNCLATQNVKEN